MSVIEVRDLHHVYLDGTPFAAPALHGVTMDVEHGEFLGIVGPSRSGKSTLVEFFNGLLVPRHGEVSVLGTPITSGRGGVRDLRRQIGLVFQYPEAQLFAETVAEDVAFGPRNFGVGASALDECVDDGLRRVNLDPATYRDRAVVSLSGGEKRRVAIAGVLASAPSVVVLDEPTAGIDPDTRASLLTWLGELHRAGTTVVVVSNSAVEVAPLADRLVVLNEGSVMSSGTPYEVLAQEDVTSTTGIGVSASFEVIRRLRQAGHPTPNRVGGPGEAAAVIASLVTERARAKEH